MKIKPSIPRLFLVLFCLTSTLNINAQKLTFDWGKEFNKLSKYTASTYLGEDNEAYYIFTKGHEMGNRNIKYTFERYSLNHKLISSTEVYLNSNQQEAKNSGELLDVYKNEEHFVILFTESEEKTNIPVVYSQTLGKTGKVSKTQIILSDPDFSWKKKSPYFSPYSIIRSLDNSKILLVERTFPKLSNKFILFSSNFEKLWEKTFDENILIPYSSFRESTANQYVICDNNGNVVWLTGFENIDKDQSINRFKLNVYRPTTNVISEIKLQFDPSKYTMDLSLLHTNDNIYVSGFYHNQTIKQNRLAINGFTYNRINLKTLEVEQSVAKEFDAIMLSKLFSKISINLQSKNDDAYIYSTKNIVERENGTIQFISEGYGAHGLSQQVDMVFYKSLSIVGLQFNKDGDLNWGTCIPKNQGAYPGDHVYLSYIMNIQKDKLVFIYTDSRKNLDKLNDNSKIVDEMNCQSKDNLIPILATIDNQGELTKENLIVKAQLLEMGIIPNFLKTNTGNQIRINAESKTKGRFGIIQIEP